MTLLLLVNNLASQARKFWEMSMFQVLIQIRHKFSLPKVKHIENYKDTRLSFLHGRHGRQGITLLNMRVFLTFVEDLEEDCEISIRRELEEMERVLQGDDSVDLKGNLTCVYKGIVIYES